MNEVTTADRLKQLMQERGLKQVDIINRCQPYCEHYGVRIRSNDMSQYLSGRSRPNQIRLTILGLALNVSEVWLMGYDVPKERTATTDVYAFENIRPIEKQKIPMVGEIACGKPIFASEDRESYVLAGTDIQADFCLICRGDSMIGARIYDGDIVFIRKQPTVENGEIAAVIIGDEATLKRVYYYPEKQKLILQAENPEYEPFVYMNEELSEISILGKAIAFQSDIRHRKVKEEK